MTTHFGFGVNIHTFLQPGIDPVSEAVHAEELGYEMVSLHRDVIHGNQPSYEMWTLLTWLAARTSTIKVAPVVLALPNRPPAVLAKMVETLDRLSEGRFILVLGAGGPMNEPGYHSLGLDQRNSREKVLALEEAIDVIRGLWSTSEFSYNGKHFHTEGATLAPQPDRRIPIWLGVFGDREANLVGRKADGWIPSLPLLPPHQAYQKLAAIRLAAKNAGRNPDDIIYAYNVPVLVQAGVASRPGLIAGSAAQVATQLSDLIRHGFTFLNLWPAGAAAQQRELLSQEVIPLVADQASTGFSGRLSAG